MKFPKTIFVSVAGSAGSGENEYLNAAETEQEAIKATDDEETAFVAEYQLVSKRKRSIVITVEEAK